MSWLLVAGVPALLMLVAVGLERIETGLIQTATVTAEVAALLGHAEGGGARMAVGTNPQFRPTRQADPV